MKKILILILLVIIYSCKQENESNVMYGFLNEDFVFSSEILKVEISENLKKDKIINNKSAKLFNNLTTEYLKYLNQTYSELTNNSKIKEDWSYEGELSKKKYSNELFFIGEKYSKKGTEFISKLEKYRTEILKLIENKNLAKRVNISLNTNYVLNREGKKINYLNYIYKDLPLISVLAHLKNKEKSILEFENEFLKNIELQEYKKSEKLKPTANTVQN